jgi:hypothetical protein
MPDCTWVCDTDVGRSDDADPCHRLGQPTSRSRVEVRRLALNIDQVKQYGPPPNPAKETDSRFASYGNQYGSDCWELDALDPAVIADLVRSAPKSRQ